uniref:Uncharacterized protein n=1 Tax=Globisporangium ultimum (strain ATCC 200006 / CBS 805.95 / DAOM BR144) TaxID=431595 RepID=K3WU32_GLOUD
MPPDPDPAALEWSYELVPSFPLPVLDLSRSLKSRYLPHVLLQRIDDFLALYNRPLFVCYVLSLVLSISVPLLDAETGCYVALISALLGLPLGLGSLGTLRYDVVRLLVRTYDFWSFLFVNGATNLMVAMIFSDLRMSRLIIDWSGFQNIVLIDAQLRGIRQLWTLAVVGTFTVLMLLTCVMLGRVDRARGFSIFQYTNQNSSYEVSANDVVGNGLVTIFILLLKIVYRKRKAFRRRPKKQSIIECAIYRCRVKLSPCTVRHFSPVEPSPPDPGLSPNKHRDPLTCEPQQSTTESYLNQLLKNGCVPFVLTASFTITIASFYQSELLIALATSFDFVFYAFQLTSIHTSLCVLYEWDVSRCLGVAASWLWIHWVLTLDALTPMMKAKLNFRTRFGIPVVTMFILWHVIILFHILSGSGPKDRVIWEGNIWAHHLQVRVVPFYFSRLVTLTLWSVRMVNRLVMSTNEDATILRGAVTHALGHAHHAS